MKIFSVIFFSLFSLTCFGQAISLELRVKGADLKNQDAVDLRSLSAFQLQALVDAAIIYSLIVLWPNELDPLPKEPYWERIADPSYTGAGNYTQRLRI